MAAAGSSSDGNNNKASSTMVTLISSDNVRFEVDEAAASLSRTLYLMMLEGGGGRNGIPLPNVDAATLAKVIEYCNKHAPAAGSSSSSEGEQQAVDTGASNAAAAAAASESDRAAELERFDKEFVNMDTSMLFSIINAADYLEVKGLLDICGQTVADMIKGKTLGIPEPTPEEDAEIIAEINAAGNAWAFQ